MKKIFVISSLLGLLLSATSCKRDFLDSAPTETLADPPAQAKLYGLYLMMVNKNTGGTTSHDDFGQKGYDIYMDILSSDMALEGTNYGYYSGLADLTAPTNYTNTVNYKPWRYYYRIAYAANDVIAGLGGNDAVPTDDNKYAMGQAKAMRAYAYFYLSQLYTEKYDAAAPGIPLYTTTSVAAQPKAKQSEVYAQIIKDLKDAVTLLDGYSRPNKGVINKYVAEGLLAYAYAATGDYTNAATASLDVINKGDFAITTKDQTVYDEATKKGGGFNDLSTGSWMWGFDLTLANDLDLVSWWGQADVFSYSYAWAGDPKGIDLGLWAKIPDYDIRKNQFRTITPTKTGFTTANADQDGDYQAVPANKFFDPNRKIGGQRSIITDYVFMRVDEFYLLAAESLAKSGDEAQAKTILKNLLSNRVTDVAKLAYIDGLSGAKLQDEIYLQTRIELWGEGKSYLAMKRNKATVTRGANHLFFVDKSFSYDDPRLTLDIPQAEVNNNPNLK